MTQITEPSLKDETARPSLAVWATLGEAYAIWFANLWLWLKLCTIPVVILIGLTALGPSVLPGAEDSGTHEMGFAVAGYFTVFFIFVFLAEVPPVTAWHRIILMGDNAQTRRYVIGLQEWRYILKLSLILLYLLLAILVVGFAIGLAMVSVFGVAADGAPAISGALEETIYNVTAFGIYLVMFRFIGHLFLGLPAAAIGAGLSGKEGKKALKTNEWRLVGIVVLSMAPPLLAGFALSRAADGAPIPGIYDLLGYVIAIIFAPVIVGVLSIAYRELVQKPQTSAL